MNDKIIEWLITLLICCTIGGIYILIQWWRLEIDDRKYAECLRQEYKAGLTLTSPDEWKRQTKR